MNGPQSLFSFLLLFYLLTSKTVAITITRCSMSATRCSRLGAILQHIDVKFDKNSTEQLSSIVD